MDNGTKTVNLNEFDEITYIKRGREVPFNINDAELRKLKITIERTVEEDKNGKKKRKLKITIST
ncbi:MAG: hypothetical protein R3B84_12695 [Zavarzinella sp.]